MPEQWVSPPGHAAATGSSPCLLGLAVPNAYLPFVMCAWEISDQDKYRLIQSKRLGCLNLWLLEQMVAVGPLCLKKAGCREEKGIAAHVFPSNTHSAYSGMALEDRETTDGP